MLHKTREYLYNVCTGGAGWRRAFYRDVLEQQRDYAKRINEVTAREKAATARIQAAHDVIHEAKKACKYVTIKSFQDQDEQYLRDLATIYTSDAFRFFMVTEIRDAYVKDICTRHPQYRDLHFFMQNLCDDILQTLAQRHEQYREMIDEQQQKNAQ